MRFKVLVLALVALLIMVVSGCPPPNPDAAANVEVTTADAVSTSLNSLEMGEGVAYIPLYLLGDSNLKTSRTAYIKALDQFQEEKRVKVTSWNIDKQPDGYATPAIVFGLTVTYTKLP